MMADAKTRAFFPLEDLSPGRRYLGEVTLSAEKSLPGLRVSRPVDLTWVPCRNLPDAKDGNAWAALPVMDISAWSRTDAGGPPAEEEGEKDGSVWLQAGWFETGLRFRIRVRDADHRQTQSAQQMWREDSVQLAFDMDA